MDKKSNKLSISIIFILQKKKEGASKVPAMRNWSKNFSFDFFLHHLIECELLITNIYFLSLVNDFFRSKNTKYSTGVIFRTKTHLFQIV